MNKSSSSMKLDISSDEEDVEETSGFILIINSGILMSLMVMLCHCPECDGSVNTSYEPSKKRGFAFSSSLNALYVAGRMSFAPLKKQIVIRQG